MRDSKIIKLSFLALPLLLTILSCQSEKTAPKLEKQKPVIKKEVLNAAVLTSNKDSLDSPVLDSINIIKDIAEQSPNDEKEKKVEKEKKEIAKAKPKKAKNTAKKPKKYSKIEFDKDVFKFGTIKPGDVIEHKFEFTNTGKADLIISDAVASCGCTQPSFPFIPIKPGEKGYIGVKYDSKGKLGVQKPTVTITTNSKPKTTKIYLEGLVISEMAKSDN